MKKYLFIAAAAVAMLASCSQSDDLSAPVTQQNTEDNAVQFGTYLGKSTTSRAGSGATGAIVDRASTGNKIGDTNYEFGVFSVYSPGTAYNSITDRTPNFMYNEKVYWETSAFKYDNLKYWPNGKASSSDADADTNPTNSTSTTLNYLNFFAYAPYVNKTSALGQDYGIIEINGSTTAITSEAASTGKNAKNNPIITYKLDPSNFVDLLWGTAGTNGANIKGTAQNGGIVNSTTDGTTITSGALNAGKNVNIDMTKQKTDGTVNFNFLHALAMLGGTDGKLTSGIKIQADPDEGSITGAETKITVVDLTIELASVKDKAGTTHVGYATEGKFDLARGVWYDQTWSGSADTHNYYAPGSDSYASATDAQKVLNSDIAEPNTFTWEDATPAGVISASAKSVFANDVTAFYLIPDTKPTYNITITYKVRTKDTKLAAGYSDVTQTISKTIEFGDYVKLNKCYNLLIKLGLTSVKFEASVTGWSTDTDDDAGTDDTVVVNLPLNVAP